MTMQALAWALDQPVPGVAGRVLIALANRADHLTGRIDFDPGVIAGEAVIREPSLWRYLGALERNGYLAKESRKASDAEKREYWLALDRDPTLPWAWSSDGDGERSEPEGVDLVPGRAPESAASKSRRFDRSKQNEQRKAATAPEPGRTEGLVPVIEGSRAHRDWCSHLRLQRKLIPFSRTMIVNGQQCRGFEMPTLFPPAEMVEDDQVIDG